MASIKEIVEHEIEEYKQKYGENFLRYFNNFSGNLPFGYYRIIFKNIVDKTFTDEKASERLRSMTHREFYQDIDDTISELGLDLNEIRRLQESMDLAKLYDLTLPLYVRLREKGYNHYPNLIA